jgi:ELP3 family radical SAM enzyme/protein acetyltransferase
MTLFQEHVDIEDVMCVQKKQKRQPSVLLFTYVNELIKNQDSIVTEKDVSLLLNKLRRRLKHVVTKNDIRVFYDTHKDTFSRSLSSHVYQFLTKRAVRSRSGIVNVSVVLPPHRFSCHYDCSFCPKEPNMPRSYLSNEDAVARAASVDFDAVQQVFSRLETLSKNGHPLDKIEFRLLGGTFSSYPHDVVDTFIRDLYYAVNVYPTQDSRERRSLSEEIDENSQHARIHVVGLGLETRPDTITFDEICRFRRFGCTRVELGVQHTNDEVLRKSRRGHGIEQSKRAVRLLKDHGFKVEMHIMIDLPGTTPELDRECYERVLCGEDLLPDYLKDYPCLDVIFTDIRQMKKDGGWTPYAEREKDAKTLRNVLVYRQQVTPCCVRVNRIQRDFSHVFSENDLGYTSTSLKTNLGQIVRDDAERQGIFCQCIRCCEVRDESVDMKNMVIDVVSFRASGCQEYFIRAIVQRSPRPLLLGFLRLRITRHAQVPELRGCIGLIRELHVYGRVQTVGQKNLHGVQHRGIGRRLLKRAEYIAFWKHGVSKVAVIAGIGVRNYYAKYGYHLEGTYMIRHFFMSRFLCLMLFLCVSSAILIQYCLK